MNILYQEKLNKVNSYYKKLNGSTQWEYGAPSENQEVNEVLNTFRIEDIGKLMGKEREIHISFKQKNTRYKAVIVRKEMAKEYAFKRIDKNFLENQTWRWLIYVKRKSGFYPLRESLLEQRINDRYSEIEEWLNHLQIFNYIELVMEDGENEKEEWRINVQ